MKTPIPSQKEVVRRWHLLDAEGVVLGRLATQAAILLMGKHKPNYTPFLDMGDHVVVINAARVRVTGKKEDQKIYRHHSGYPGGLKEIALRKLRAKHPERIVFDAIAGMLPKTRLGKRMLRKLRVYAGDKHPHQGQKPEPVAIVA